MPRERFKKVRGALRPLLIGALIGTVVALIMPDEWSNFAETPPWYAGPIIAPAFLVFLALSIVTLTDFVSNDGANPVLLETLWVVSVALVASAYALLVWAVARFVARKRSGRKPAS